MTSNAAKAIPTIEIVKITRLIGLWSVFVALTITLIGCSETKFSIGPSSAHSIQDVCNQANLLVSKGEPQKAIELINSIRKETSLDHGTSSGTQAASPPCNPEYINALYKIGFTATHSTPAPGFPKTWESSVNLWAVPPFGLGLGFLALIIVAVAAARLISRIPLAEYPRTRKPLRITVTWISSIMVAVGAIWPAVLISNIAVGFNLHDPILLYLSFVPIVVGTLALGWAFAQRMRLRITVRDSTGKTNESHTTQIVALLRELGYKKPYGVDVPLGTGTKALTGSTVIGTPENRILAILQLIFEALLGITPWHVLVDSVEPNILVVVISRNGRSKSAAHLDRRSLDLAGSPPLRTSDASDHGIMAPAPDLHKMAAAVIIATLAASYKDFQSLCGALEWRSIGYQYVAATDYRNDKMASKHLLGKALEIDCNNFPANLMLHDKCYRSSADGKDLLEYADWLLQQSHNIRPLNSKKIPQGYEHSYQLCLSGYLTTVRNLRSIPTYENAHPRANLKADELIELLSQDANQADRQTSATHSVRSSTRLQMAQISRVGLLTNATSADLNDLIAAVGTSGVFVVRYNLGCVLLGFGATSKNSTMIDVAIRHLRFGVNDTRLKEWAARDPVLVKVATNDNSDSVLSELQVLNLRTIMQTV